LSGGGAGAPQLFQLVLAAMRPLMHSNSLRLRFVAGPFGSADQIEVPNEFEEYIDLVAEASTDEAIRDASVVISRAGYNTSYALVQTELPLIFVPLPAPGDEQSYRAQKLARLLNVSAVDQTDPSVPELLRAALEQALNCEPSSRELPFRTDGAARTADFITALSSADGGTI
jgi:predicted glycosyltransferase